MQTLLPDVVAPEAHQNDHSYVHELISNYEQWASQVTMQDFCMLCGYTEDVEKPQNVKIRGWTLAQVWAFGLKSMVVCILSFLQPEKCKLMQADMTEV